MEGGVRKRRRRLTAVVSASAADAIADVEAISRCPGGSWAERMPKDLVLGGHYTLCFKPCDGCTDDRCRLGSRYAAGVHGGICLVCAPVRMHFCKLDSLYRHARECHSAEELERAAVRYSQAKEAEQRALDAALDAVIRRARAQAPKPASVTHELQCAEADADSGWPQPHADADSGSPRARFFRKQALSSEEMEAARRMEKPTNLENRDEIIVERKFLGLGYLEVSRRHLRTLFGADWLDDEVINYYIGLISVRNTEAVPPLSVKSVILSTLFYTRLTEPRYDFKQVRTWTRNIDIFAMDVVIIPINIAWSHWTCVAVNFRSKQFQYYDGFYDAGCSIIENLRKWLSDEHMLRTKQPIDLSREGWRDVPPSEDRVPRQTDGNSCGVFACINMDYLSTGDEGLLVGGGEDAISQSDIPYFRLRIASEIIQNRAYMHTHVRGPPRGMHATADAH